jgi:hypothetical protein
VDADSLCAELLSVFFDHFFAALDYNVRFGFGWRVFLLHSEVAHFSCVQALFGI